MDFWNDLKSGKFAAMVKEVAKGKKLSDSNMLYNVLKPMMAEHDDIEVMYGVFMNAKNKVVGIEKLATGSLSVAVIFPREVVKRVLALKASAFVMAHNHPSGDVTPSPEDRQMTMRLFVALRGIDVKLHDHIIIGNGYYSMADNGDIARFFNKYVSIM